MPTIGRPDARTAMRESDFTDASPGRLVAAQMLDGSDWPAFVPDPLPPELTWSQTTVGLLSQADQALSRLNGRASSMPNITVALTFGRIGP